MDLRPVAQPIRSRDCLGKRMCCCSTHTTTVRACDDQLCVSTALASDSHFFANDGGRVVCVYRRYKEEDGKNELVEIHDESSVCMD